MAQYKPSILLLTSYFAKSDSSVRFAKRRAALNVCIEISGAVIALDAAGDKRLTYQ